MAMQFHQLDYYEKAVGRLNPESKVNATWQFGNLPQVRYQIELIWSLSSGRHSIKWNGESVYMSSSPGASILDFHLDVSEEIKIHVMAVATKPSHMDYRFRRFEIEINGIPFTLLPRCEGGRAAYQHQPSVLDILYPRRHKRPDASESPYAVGGGGGHHANNAVASSEASPHAVGLDDMFPPQGGQGTAAPAQQEVDLLSFE